MVPLYQARIEDLGPGDFVRVECAACGHDALIHPSALPRLQFQARDLVLGLSLIRVDWVLGAQCEPPLDQNDLPQYKAT
jgi:hypothetical protein